MKLTKTVSSVLLASLLLALAACGETAQGGQETTPATGTTDTAAPEEYDFGDKTYGGYEFKVLNYSDMWDTNVRLDFENESGEMLDDAIYKRNRYVEDKLDFVLKEIAFTYPGWDSIAQNVDRVIESVLADDKAYDAASLPVCFKPEVITQNYLYDLQEVPGLNLDAEWWDHSVNDSMTVCGTLYAASSPMQLVSLDLTWVLLFNEKMMTDLDMEKPYQLVRDGKWTLDTFFEYVQAGTNIGADESFSFKENGTAVYGIAVHTDCPIGFVNAAGNELLLKKGDDYSVNIETERMVNTVDKLAKIFSAKDGYILGNNDETQPSGYTTLFRNERAMFMTCELKSALVERDMDATFGLLPMPKYDEAQKDYYSAMNICTSLLTIPVTQDDPEMAGRILDALTYVSYRDVLPIYYDVTLSQKGLRNEDSVDMLNIIRNTRGVDFGCVFGINNSFVSSVNRMIVGGKNNIASVAASQAPAMETKLADILALLGK
ncbi:MAG: hypothetical protein MJ175_05030 [Clostridia bacterium]|nr:hypothetical protein [Clostridia bacterium]